MRRYIDNILQEIDAEIDRFDIYDIIENSIKMIDLIQAYIDKLREQVIIYEFSSLEEEWRFFSKQQTRPCRGVKNPKIPLPL